MKNISYILFLISLSVFSQISFTDVASFQGINSNYGVSNYGGSVSFIDFDGDGWDDLSFSSEIDKQIYFYKNNNGSFSEITLNGISNTQKTKQLIWVDYDNDGDKDLFVAGFIGTNKVYQNDGNLNFTEISESLGLFQDDLFTNSISFGDIDNDGDLDLLLTHRDEVSESQRNYLYRNDGNIFTEITENAGLVMTSELTLCATFFDFNNDGYQDIYVSNDKPTYKNRLYKNNAGDGTFTDVSDSSGAGIEINAMTTTIGDYNNDGWFDIYVTNTPQGNVLLKNNGDETFTDVTVSSNTTFDSLGWGAVFLDADNDGFEDLYVSGSFDGTTPPNLLSMAFYHNQQDNTFNLNNNVGFQNDSQISFSNAIGDINNDGKPEIVVCNNTDAHSLWQNETSNTNNWLKVKLIGDTSNKDGVGNKIEVFSNSSSQYRFTSCGEGYMGQNSNYEFFGLSNASIIDYIRVTWNKTGIIETYTDVAINQAITIKEGEGILNVEENQIINLSIAPNPSSGIYRINTTNNLTDFKVKVYDISGREIKINLPINNIIDLSKYSSGIYILKFKGAGINYSKKIIKN